MLFLAGAVVVALVFADLVELSKHRSR